MKPSLIIAIAVVITLAVLFLLNHLWILVLGVSLFLVNYLRRLYLRAESERCGLNGDDYVIAWVFGIILPFGLLRAVACEEERKCLGQDLKFLVTNRFYYLRNPVVIRKSDDDSTNNQEEASRPPRASDYIRGRSRH